MSIRKFIAVLTASAVMISYMGITAAADDKSLLQLDAQSHGYGQGNERDENNCPIGATMFNDEYSVYHSYAIFDNRNGICLTFDQGYENGYTESILDTLKDKNVKAVFFLTGDYAKRNKELVQRMIDEGHVIGNHGMKHESLPMLSPDEAREEIMTLHDYVKQEYGYEMKYFRPPCGEFSERSLAVTDSLGYTTLLWSFAYCDWDVNNQPDVGTAFDKVSGAAHNGAIYLLHSVSATNTEILPGVIDSIREQGFEFYVPQ